MTDKPTPTDAVALARYKVVPAHESMFHRFAVVAGDGKQQLYLGREVECENMARKFAGAFLDGAFYQANITPSTQAAGSVPAVEREQERIAFKDAHRHLELYEVPDAWGRPMFKHSHVEASWLGWIARASHGQAPAGATELAEADRRAGAAERKLAASKEDVARIERVRDMTHPDTLQIPRAVVEPAYLMSPDGKCYAPSKPPLSAGNAKGTLLTLYTATAIAAARVQALEEAVKVCEGASSYLEHQQHLLASRDCANAIRALIGKESK